jgi:GNAT superfamily N-acetyltransferase
VSLPEFLTAWLGAWPDPPKPDLTVVGSPERLRPAWDGRITHALGVTDADGRGVISVQLDKTDEVQDLVAGAADPAAALAEHLVDTLGLPGWVWFSGVFRWAVDRVDLPSAGTWEPADGPHLPDWLRPFGGDVLVARDPSDGAYLAGVGLKRHNALGVEIAVGTEPAARGQGLARKLVAEASRTILDRGAVPLYLHDPANIASAHVADASGFPDQGWHIHGLWNAPPA